MFVFPALISLGLWQLDRADEKRLIEDNVNAAGVKSPLDLNEEYKGDLKSEVYRQVIVEGRFDDSRQYLWDNKTHDGRPGFHVLTPLLIRDMNVAVMVNRGWVPMLGRRDVLPEVTVARGVKSIQGVIKDPSNAIQLAESVRTNVVRFPSIIQSFDTDVFSSELNVPVLPIMIELAKNNENGYVRNWKPYFGNIERHNGYALQWFLMALIVLFLYVKLNTKRSAAKQP